MHTEIFGTLATLLMIASRGEYFRSIFQGATRPHAFSWLIWGVISSIGFAAQVAEGAGPGSWARGFGAATCFALVAVSMFKGEGHIRRADWVTLCVALFTIPLWVATKTPVWSVLLVCTIDTLGYVPTWRKSWGNPWQESARGYALSTLGAFFSILAIEHYTLSTWLYPTVLVFSNGGTALYLLSRRRNNPTVSVISSN